MARVGFAFLSDPRILGWPTYSLKAEYIFILTVAKQLSPNSGTMDRNVDPLGRYKTQSQVLGDEHFCHNCDNDIDQI